MKYKTVESICVEEGVRERTVKKWAKKSNIPVIKKGRKEYIPSHLVEKLLLDADERANAKKKKKAANEKNQ